MSKTYPTLYARATTGKILEWYVEQKGGKYRVVSGQQDGKKVVSEWTSASPKNLGKVNETTDVEQATIEIEALYTKKKKQKYKDTVEDIDVQTYFKPMLAKKYVDYKDKINFFDGNWLISCKLNGMRAICSKDGMFSRTGERIWSVPHIEKELAPLFDESPNLVLDGELFSNNLRQKLNELISLCRKTVDITPDDLQKSEQIVQYHIYDCYITGEESYSDRYAFIDRLVDTYDKYCYKVKADVILSEQHMLYYYNELIDDGHEGAILRNKNSLYENKRSKNLLKLKPEMDDECVIINVMEGDGNWSGKCKTFTVEWNGKIFDASLKGSMEDAIEIWNNKDQWIGRRVKFLYNDCTGLGIPNFARIDCNNCEPST